MEIKEELIAYIRKERHAVDAFCEEIADMILKKYHLVPKESARVIEIDEQHCEFYEGYGDCTFGDNYHCKHPDNCKISKIIIIETPNRKG